MALTNNPQKKIRYKGFSSRQFALTGSSRLTDVELVKEDLFNHIFTRRGERVMMDYGTEIPDMVFEFLDDDLVERLYDELLSAVNADPRIRLDVLNVVPVYDENAVVATLSVTYIELNVSETFDLNIQFETIN